MLLKAVSRVVPALLLAILWEPVRLLNGADWSWAAVAWRFALGLIALVAGAWAMAGPRRWRAFLVIVVPLVLLACLLDLHRADTRVAALAIAGLYALLLSLESAFYAKSREVDSRLIRLEYGAGLFFLAVIGGVIPVVLAQVEAQFAEEEFFIAIQIPFLAVFTLFLLISHIINRRLDVARQVKPVKVRPLWGMLALSLGGAIFLWWTAQEYQASFYASTPPNFDGVSPDAPFLCASLPPVSGAADGQGVFEQIQRLVAANPNKGAAEYGMLALATGEEEWANAFRKAILADAEASRFTEPANSVKYGQHLAAQRAYYFSRVHEAFPNLFSNVELATLKDWFAAVNRRAMTVEWVDLLYGLAFSVRPAGPYENQENGAGLLALLESAGLGDSELSAANRDYLARNLRGWVERFRNTDDAYLYQTEWIDNAYFQSIYQKQIPDPLSFERHRRLAFEWLLLQMLPGGAPLTYNRPEATPIANTLYLGALLLDDPRYVWAADQVLGNLMAHGGFLAAQPGLEHASHLTGISPDQGSCLLFSPSGLPTQVGPLAPDKIVFRDGWTSEATYLLLNLRFTGWHRYKGTNGAVLLYHNGPIVVEESTGESFRWLPSGRSLFRDKRIPRENLNGLLIPRTGFSQMTYLLSGVNGPWAQDPPHHARVEGFFSLGLLDASRTTIEDWRGWRHHRTVYFLHGGPLIVVDAARNEGGGQSALVWHLNGIVERTEEGLWLRRGDAPVRVAMSSGSWRRTALKGRDGQDPNTLWELTFTAPDSGKLDLVTTFLMDGWSDAKYEIEPVRISGEQVGQYLLLNRGEQGIRLLHNAQWSADDSKSITASGLSTDGLALIVQEDFSGTVSSVCKLGGSQVVISLDSAPRSIRVSGSQMDLQRGTDWEWEDQVLTLGPSLPTSTCLDIGY